MKGSGKNSHVHLIPLVSHILLCRMELDTFQHITAGETLPKHVTQN